MRQVKVGATRMADVSDPRVGISGVNSGRESAPTVVPTPNVPWLLHTACP